MGNVREDGVGVFWGWDFIIEAVISLVPGRVLCVDCRWHGVPLRLMFMLPVGEAPRRVLWGAGGFLLHL